MKIGYVRTSTAEQNTARQEALMEALGVDEVYIDRMSGKTTQRPELQKMMEYVRLGDEIIFTRDTHQENYLDTMEGKKLPVKHCIQGTKGWEIADGLYVEGCKIIDKPNFGWPNWKEENLEEVELVGLCTDICVVSNALIMKATFPEAIVKVDSACCAGVTVESHEAALKTMQMCQVEVM